MKKIDAYIESLDNPKTFAVSCGLKKSSDYHHVTLGAIGYIFLHKMTSYAERSKLQPLMYVHLGILLIDTLNGESVEISDHFINAIALYFNQSALYINKSAFFSASILTENNE